MKKYFKTAKLIDYSDEDLIKLAQKGALDAADAICSRYIGAHESFANVACPAALNILDDWVISDSFIDCLLVGVQKFRAGTGATFKTFLVNLYQKRLKKEIARAQTKINVISLDQDLFLSPKGSALKLSDIIAVEESGENTPKKYVDYEELKLIFSEANIQDETLFDVIELLVEGLPLQKACSIVGMSYNRARYLLSILKKFLVSKGVAATKTKE